MINSIDTQSKAIDRNEENRLPDLEFADSIALTAESIKHIQALTTILEKAAATVGFTICQDKRKFIVICQQDNIRIPTKIK